MSWEDLSDETLEATPMSECDCNGIDCTEMAYMTDGWPAEPPPTVCEYTMWLSCLRWMQCRKLDMGPIPGIFPLGPGINRDILINARWPMSVANGDCYMVLHHWIEGEEDPKLGKIYEDNPAWQNATEGLRRLFSGPPSKTDREKMLDISFLSMELQAAGIIPTPKTVQYACQTANPDWFPPTVEGPTRGMYIETFVFVSASPGHPIETAFNLGMSNASNNTDLWRRAQMIVNIHQDWVRRVFPGNLASYDARQAGGHRKHDDDLHQDILLHLKGSMTIHQVTEHECARQADLRDKDSPLTKYDRDLIADKIRKRIKRQKEADK